MNFLTPLAFLLAITFPIIIAMYLLKLRRTEQRVSSTYLWHRMVRDLEANAPWQRLRRNLLLFLQLLFLLFLILSLVRPYTWAAGTNSAATILVLDTSASMAAKDVAPNRMQVAKDQASLIVSNLPEDSRTTLIAAGYGAQVLVSSSTDRRLVLNAIEDLQVTPTASDLANALELAAAVAARQPEAEIVVISDGRVDLPARLSLPVNLRYIPVGESGDNQAITAFSIESAVEGDSLTAFIQVTNFSETAVTRRLSLVADGRLVDVQDAALPALGQASLISQLIPEGSVVVEAVLEAGDYLSLDDHAWALSKDDARDRLATLVSPGNRFLETALGLLPGVEIKVVAPEDWGTGNLDPNLVSPQPPDLTIFDRVALTGTPPGGSLLFLQPLAGTSLFSVTGTIENPTLVAASRADPLLSHMDLSQVTVLDAVRIPLPDWARPVLLDETSGYPLLFSGEPDGQRVIVLAFDPRRSDLPLQPAFPILVSNMTAALLPGRLGDVPQQVACGEALVFTPLTGTETLAITRPDGSVAYLEVQEGRAVFGDTLHLGVYRVTWQDGSLEFAVNLSDSQESNIKPVETLSQFAGGVAGESQQNQQARREWWRPLAWLALVVLVVEWLVYQRATLMKLIHKLPFFHPAKR